MRIAVVALTLAILLSTRSSEAGPGAQSYGWLDVGGMIAVPADRSPTEYGAGFAFSSGVQFLSYVQAGGRLRLARTSERMCSPPSPGETGCGSSWSGDAASLGLELRLRFPVTPRLAVALGGSLSIGLWSRNGTYTFGGGGGNLAADLRVAYLLGRRIGVHVAFEQ